MKIRLALFSFALLLLPARALGLAIFCLLCLQLGDIMAEPWRGKKRSEIFRRKSFSFQVAARKD